MNHRAESRIQRVLLSFTLAILAVGIPSSLAHAIGHNDISHVSLKTYLNAPAAGYIVSGYVKKSDGTGLGATTVRLYGNGLDQSLTNGSDGYYSWGAVPNGTYTVTPSKQGWTFTPASRSIAVSNANVTVGDFVGTQTGYNLYGYTKQSSGAVLSSVSVTCTGNGINKTVTSGTDGYYSCGLVPNGTYTLSATKSGWTITPSSQSVTVSGAAKQAPDFIGSQTGYNLYGYTLQSSGAALSSVSVTCTGNGINKTVTSGTDGYYSCGLVPNGTYTLNASKSGWTITPSSQSVTVSGAAKQAPDFVGSQTGYNLYGYTMQASGSALSGVSVTCAGNGINKTVTSGTDGYYSCGLVQNGTYTLSASKSGWTFSPSSQSITVSGAAKQAPDFIGTQAPRVLFGYTKQQSGVALSSVSITLTGNGQNSTVPSGTDGYYSFSVTDGTYTLSAFKTGWSFSPSSQPVTVSGSNTQANDFVGIQDFSTIGGVVTDSSGIGMSGVTVSDGAGHSTATISDGSYILSSLSAGTYTVSASKTGYSFTPSSRTVTVPPSATSQNFTGSVIYYSISGRVADRNNNGIPGATISDGNGHSTTTDSNGNYTLSTLPAGTYTLTASKSGYGSASLPPVTLPPSLTGQNFTIDLITYSISGRTMDSSNNAISGASISDGNGHTTTSDSSGNYTLGTLPAGNYVLSANKTNYTFSTLSAITVPPSATGKDFIGTLVTYSISGRTVDSGNGAIGGVTISDGAAHSTASDSSGNYTVDNLTAGTYTLTATKSGYSFSTLPPITVPPNASDKNFTGTLLTYSISGYVKDSNNNPITGVELTIGGVHAAYVDSTGYFNITGLSVGSYILVPAKTGYAFSPPSRTVSVPPSATSQDFTGGITPTYSISGRTADSSNNAIPGVTISDGVGHAANSDSSGNYTLGGLPAGSYTPVASKSGYTFSTLPAIIVPPSATGKDFTGTLTTYSISGRVADFLNNGLAGVTISDGNGHSTTSGTDGNYTLGGLGPGTYSLTAIYAGYDFSTLPPVTIPPNAINQNFTGTPQVTLYTISGRVLDAKANPIMGATVSDNAGHTSSPSDGSGAYSIGPVAVGTYTLTAHAVGHTFPSTISVTVPPSQIGVNFYASGPAWTFMVYLDGENNLGGKPVPGKTTITTTLGIFNGLEQAANNANVNITVMMQNWNEDAAYYKVRYDTDRNRLATYTPGAEYVSLNHQDMGVPQTLIDFVTWSKTNYPAPHYALVLFNHGSGLGGAMVDDSSGNHMSVTDIASALRSTTATSTGTQKLDVLIMDACLMHMIEDANQFQPYVLYYVASENLLYAGGKFDIYSGVIGGITNSTNGQQLATSFASAYKDAQRYNSSHYTISAGDLTQLPDVVTATHALAADLNAQLDTIAITMTNVISPTVQRFDTNADKQYTAGTWIACDPSIDLYDFAQKVKANIPGPSVQTHAQSVMDKITQYILPNGEFHRLAGPVENSHGLAVFFPCYQSSFYSRANYEFALGSNWPGGGARARWGATSGDTWGLFVSNLIGLVAPNSPNRSTPPPPVSQIEASPAFEMFLPTIRK